MTWFKRRVTQDDLDKLRASFAAEIRAERERMEAHVRHEIFRNSLPLCRNCGARLVNPGTMMGGNPGCNHEFREKS